MAREGDREVVARLELPLPLAVAGAVGIAIAEALEGLGYTDVAISTTHGYRISALPPGPVLSSPDDTITG